MAQAGGQVKSILMIAAIGAGYGEARVNPGL